MAQYDSRLHRSYEFSPCAHSSVRKHCVGLRPEVDALQAAREGLRLKVYCASHVYCCFARLIFFLFNRKPIRGGVFLVNRKRFSANFANPRVLNAEKENSENSLRLVGSGLLKFAGALKGEGCIPRKGYPLSY